MLLLRNVNCVSIVEFIFLFLFFNVFFFIIIQKVTYLMTTKNVKKKKNTKGHKKYYLRCLF